MFIIKNDAFEKGYRFICNEIKEEKEKNSYKIAFEDDIINKPYFFHVFAFVLGAFWNIKRIVKIGIM